MLINPKQRQLKIALIFFSAILFANLIIAPQVQAVAAPVVTVADVPATAIAAKDSATNIWEYLRNKVATILFQNLLRKYINDLAMDAAKYLAIGAKGEEKLYIEKKWGEHWQDIADNALGDFIESFANSVISDIAAKEIKKEGKVVCDKAKEECVAKGGADCEKSYNTCLNNSGDVTAGLTLCADNKTACDAKCASPDLKCYNSCQSIYDSCSQNAGGSVEASRKAPMFDATNSPLARVNICNPSLNVSLAISLGLTQYYTGFSTHCSFSEMVKNWGNEYERQKSMLNGDFLKQMAGNFHPTGSDLGVAFLLNSNIIEYRGKQVSDDKSKTIASNGWLDVRNYAGNLVGTPAEAEARKKLADQAVWDNLGKITGDILVDAANIFLNQWAISSWTNLMGNLSSESGRGSLSYWSSQQVGRQAIENRLSKMSEPLFSAGGKIDILSQLTTCPDPSKPGPTDCVIGNEFSTAIEGKMTVIEAVRSGQLPGNWPFGFDKNGEDKIVYNQGYPYRSMIILRKYRILPVGWEVAAQEIQRRYLINDSTLTTDRPSGVTLNDLLACYSQNDDVKGYNDDGSKTWCVGLVDPNWVLKVPEYFCSRKGYGPEIVSEPNLVATGVKYCSVDNGETRTIIEGNLAPCEVVDDCCTDAELGAREKLMVVGKEKELRNFSCAAACSYSEQKLLLNRNNNYCGDEQGCLKEGRNGSCLFYGYCTEEKRSWIFNKEKKDESCDPLFNTCQSFKAPTGKTVSYLANTLDYGCQQSAIGCKEYSYNGTYNSADNTVAWDKNQNIYLNSKTGSCASKQEGCHEFIRVEDDNGVNLLADGGLEASDTDRWSGSGTVVDNTGSNRVYQGGYSLSVGSGKRGIFYGPGDQSLLPGGFVFDLDRIYTLSAYVYVSKGEVEMVMGNSANIDSMQTITTTATGEWQNLVLTILNDSIAKTDYLAIRGATSDTEFFVDNMKFEMGSTGKYSAYRANNLLYEKLLPNYLEDVCYRDKAKDFNFKDDAPAKCSEFARKCQADEVGCELYTEVNTKDQTAAQVKPNDYCPGECVGYDTFIQQPNNFYSARDEYFIPKTAKTCRASAAGCSLFVNLDKLKAGGEDNLYFSDFRRCVKPGDANSNCAEFYTWEGSDESGYQLVVYQLQANTDTTSGISQPATVDDTDTTDNNDGATCNEDVYALPYDHPQYNPDCRQFYGRDGNVSYHVMAKTITCSKECYPYRLVNNNIDVSIVSQSDCEAKQGHWDTDKENCTVCINGGVWMDEHQACVYQADPSKSQTCSASEVGCSEYEGDFGNQVKILFNDTFESGGLNGWGQSTEIVSDSLTVGGHSLKTTDDTIEKSISTKLKLGKRYVLSFMAKKKSDDVGISGIIISGGVSSNSGVGLVTQNFSENVDITGDWKNYKFDLIIAGNQEIISPKIKFNLRGQSSDLRLDNIKILEMTDTYFLIRNSWTTPDSCDQDLFGNPAPLYMLGCEQYKDRDNETHNLKSFDKLCQDSAVGCELMIDTHNSSSYAKETFNTVTVPADNFTYVVYEKSKECNLADKGCTRLGQYNDLAEAHKDVYLLNNPDLYKDIMCTKDQVGCEAWGLSDGGETYFKDPGLRACEYRQGSGSSSYSWYKIKSSRCVDNTNTVCDDQTDCGNGMYCATVGKDDNGDIKRCASKFSCEKAGDCSPIGFNCQLIDIDESCDPVDYNKTIGLGVRDGKVQPVGMAEKNPDGTTIGNAGLCPANQTGCTEYIDPESSFSYNLLANASDVNPKPDTLYILKKNPGEATISCPGGGMYRLGEDNKVYGPFVAITTVKVSQEFYIDSSLNSDSLAGEAIKCSASPTQGVELREAIVNYRLKDSLNKEKPTTVNPGKGQVLFNERSFNGGKYNALVWDVNKSVVGDDGKEYAPQKADTGNENNANALLKVDPDRQCSTWLGCRSYMENPNKPGEKICYERGLCDQMNEAGECINFISKDPPTNQTYKQTGFPLDISNMTGYSKVGYLGNTLNADMYHLATMKQEGDAKVKFDGSFENAWETDFLDFKTGTTRASIISDAKTIEKELGFGSYKIIPDGRAVGKANVFVAKEVNNAGNRQYVVSAYVFLRYGSEVELTVGRNFAQRTTGACPFESINGSKGTLCNVVDADGNNVPAAVIASTDVAGRWVRLTGSFSIPNSYQRSLPGGGTERDTRITIGINPVKGLVYFDDVRLEPGLNYKDQLNSSGNGLTTKQYMHSDCRLYPESSSMSCDYYDDSGLRKKGWAGYCLEYDPKNPAVCLLWYPIDKVESEEYEEGVALNIPKDLYYCVDAGDGCNDTNKTEPEFFCNKFIKVDKESYWYDRVAPGSAYSIPFDLLTNSANATSSFFYADFGVNAGGKTDDIVLNQKAGSGYYGAYSSLKPPLEKLSIGNVNKKIIPFVPFYGYSYASDISNDIGDGKEDRPGNLNIIPLERMDKYFCKATLDSKGNAQPVGVGTCKINCDNGEGNCQDGTASGCKSRTIGKFDDCYIGQIIKWEDSNETANDETCNDYCQWDYLTKKCLNDDISLVRPYSLWMDPGRYRTMSNERENNNADYANCEVALKNGQFIGYAREDCGSGFIGIIRGDGKEAGCLFECYNHTKFYRVASDTSSSEASKKRAVQAVKRLFTSQNIDNPCYVWDSVLKSYKLSEYSDCSLNVPFTLETDQYCAGNIRPLYNDANQEADYCIVRPTVPEVKLSSENQYLIKGKGWVAISFSSEVDKEQLPLRKYVINWGYVSGGADVTLVRNVNMNSRPSIKNGHVAYYFLDFNEIKDGDPNAGNTSSLCQSSYCPASVKVEKANAVCCKITPRVTLTDNWDATNSSTEANNPANHPSLDKPIIIWE